MSVKQGDVMIYKGKHLASIESVHTTSRRTAASIRYTRNDGVTIQEWVNVKLLAPVPEKIDMLPENTQLKIRAISQSVSPVSEASKLLDHIRKVQVDALSPMEALTKLCELKRIAYSIQS